MSSRRDFLKRVGIATPAALVAIPASPASAGGHQPVNAAEVFETYVSECLWALPEHFATHEGSNIRAMVKAQGHALAMVLALLQSRPMERT